MIDSLLLDPRTANFERAIATGSQVSVLRAGEFCNNFVYFQFGASENFL